jgi:hypothetical protein
MRRAILQIGTEKTGSTTLQSFLAANRERLAERGWRYPRFCGEANHTGLAAYALEAGRRDPIRAAFGGDDPADVPAMRARLERAARVELADGSNAIFCNEHCHSRLQSRDEIRRLRGFLAEFFDDIRVCIYLRRQDRVALSLYTTKLKSGNVPQRILPATRPTDPYFNYDLSLAAWEAEFGRERIEVRLFDRAELADGSVVTDFLATWGLGDVSDFVPVSDGNPSLRPEAQAFLRLLNPHLVPPEGVRADVLRGTVASLLERAFPGSGVRPARAEAEAFYEMFRDGNEAVRHRYFPDRASLFDESFDAYPEVADPLDFDRDTLAAVAARLLGAGQGEVCRLEAEVLIRDARLHWLREDRSAAIAALRNAVRWRPRHADAWRTLGEYLLREGQPEEAAAAAAHAAVLRPGSAEFWHFLGMARRRAGALAEALAAQERALELEPGHPGARQQCEQLAAALAAALPDHDERGSHAAGHP